MHSCASCPLPCDPHFLPLQEPKVKKTGKLAAKIAKAARQGRGMPAAALEAIKARKQTKKAVAKVWGSGCGEAPSTIRQRSDACARHVVQNGYRLPAPAQMCSALGWGNKAKKEEVAAAGNAIEELLAPLCLRPSIAIRSLLLFQGACRTQLTTCHTESHTHAHTHIYTD